MNPGGRRHDYAWAMGLRDCATLGSLRQLQPTPAIICLSLRIGANSQEWSLPRLRSSLPEPLGGTLFDCGAFLINTRSRKEVRHDHALGINGWSHCGIRVDRVCFGRSRDPGRRGHRRRGWGRRVGTSWRRSRRSHRCQGRRSKHHKNGASP